MLYKMRNFFRDELGPLLFGNDMGDKICLILPYIQTFMVTTWMDRVYSTR